MKIAFERRRFLTQIIYQLGYTKYHLNGTRLHLFFGLYPSECDHVFRSTVKSWFLSPSLSIFFFFPALLYFTKLHHSKLLLFQFRTHIQPYFASSETRRVEHFPTALQLINSLFNSDTLFEYYLDPAVLFPVR